MNKKIVNKVLLCFLLLILLLCSVACDFTIELEDIPSADREQQMDSGTNDSTTVITQEITTLTVQVMNVGQSSCAILESDGEYMVVDTADGSYSQNVVAALQKKGITTIEYLIFTHYDADHIGAGVGILENFYVNRIVSSKYSSGKESRAYKSLQEKIKENNVSVIRPNIGDVYSFGKCSVFFIAPSNDYDDINENSLAFLVTDDYGNILYIGGDSGEESEKNQIQYITKPVDVYIVNHHGSKESSCQEFLNAICPEYAIISCGKENSYGHPHDETLQRLNNLNCTVYRTDKLKEGTDIYFTFGSEGVIIK